MHRRDDGMTLVELLVAITILGIIGSVVTSTLFLALRTSTDAQTTLNESNDRETLALMFTRDAQNAPSVLTTASACMPASSTVIVRFVWFETQVGVATQARREVVYSRPTAAATSITRSICVGTSAAIGNPVSSTVTRFISAVSLNCLTSAYATDATCGVATRVVRLSVTPSSPGATPFTVDGARRPI